MIAPHDDVEAVVLAAGQGSRIGRGPKAFLRLGGRTLVERAVAVARAVAARVIVGAPPGDVDRVRALCGSGVAVCEGGATRRQTMLALLRESRAPVVLLHDVVHPFVTAALADRVIDVARRHGAAVAAAASGSSAYHRRDDGRLVRLAPGATWSSRKPFAFHRAALERGLGDYAGSVDEAGLLDLLETGGQALELVPTESWNIKLSTPDDWRLAQAIEDSLNPAPA